MSTNSSIEWTDKTWNPVVGCTHVSAGCDHCYAVPMSYRQEKMGTERYKGLTVLNKRGERHFNGQVRCVPEVLDAPLGWKKGCRIFVNSMSDFFHPGVPIRFQWKVFATMVITPRHNYQILTKRPCRAENIFVEFNRVGAERGISHVWLGTSIELSSVLHRLVALKQVPAAVRFLSLEPLLGPLPDLDLDGIHWVIVGGESGPGARPMLEEWATDIRDQCVTAKVPFFFKQWGGKNKKQTGRILQGRTWDEMPNSAVMN